MLSVTLHSAVLVGGGAAGPEGRSCLAATVCARRNGRHARGNPVLRSGRLTDDKRSVTALRIDGADELDWLLTLGAVVRTEDGESLRKSGTRH